MVVRHAATLSRNGVHLDADQDLIAAPVRADVGGGDALARPLRQLQRGADGNLQIAFGHLQYVAREPAFNPKVRGHIAEIVHHAPVFVDQNTGRHMPAQNGVIILQQLPVYADGFGGCRANRDGGRGAALIAEPRVEVYGEFQVADLTEDPVGGREHFEFIAETAQPFTAAEEQHRVLLEREVKQADHLFLHRGLEINEQIAAADQINARERRIAQQIVRRENHEFPEVGIDAETVWRFLPEKAGQARFADVCERLATENPLRSGFERGFVDIRREHRNLAGEADFLRPLDQKDCQRISFLPRGASCRPDPDIRLPPPVGEEFRHDDGFEKVEGLQVAKKLRHANQQVFIKSVEFLGITG